MRLEILENSSDTSEDEIFKLKLKRAKFKYLGLVYPFDKKKTELPDDKAREWQTKCAIELYTSEGKDLKSYAENGLSESYGRAGLSQDLLNELPPPHGGVPE